MNQLNHTIIALLLLFITWQFILKKYFVDEEQVEACTKQFLDKL